MLRNQSQKQHRCYPSYLGYLLGMILRKREPSCHLHKYLFIGASPMWHFVTSFCYEILYTYCVAYTHLLRDLHVFRFHVIRLLILFNMFHWPWVNHMISSHRKATKINTHYRSVNILPWRVLIPYPPTNYWHNCDEIRRPIDVKLNNTTSSEARRSMVNMPRRGRIAITAFKHPDLSDLRLTGIAIVG